jgi:hypothetical protein
LGTDAVVAGTVPGAVAGTVPGAVADVVAGAAADAPPAADAADAGLTPVVADADDVAP